MPLRFPHRRVGVPAVGITHSPSHSQPITTALGSQKLGWRAPWGGGISN